MENKKISFWFDEDHVNQMVFVDDDDHNNNWSSNLWK